MKLHLVLTGHWFDRIKSGEKSVEYRKMTPYWRNRIWAKRGRIGRVTFSRGYTAETITRKVTAIDIGPCPYDGWGDSYYRVHFHKYDA